VASDRFVEQIRLARAASAAAQEMREEALAACARCREVICQDRSLRRRIGEERLLLAGSRPWRKSD
jgi:cytochrome c553